MVKPNMTAVAFGSAEDKKPAEVMDIVRVLHADNIELGKMVDDVSTKGHLRQKVNPSMEKEQNQGRRRPYLDLT